MRKIIKLIFTLVSILSFTFGIIEEIDGIGRFAIILFGTVMTIVASYFKLEK